MASERTLSRQANPQASALRRRRSFVWRSAGSACLIAVLGQVARADISAEITQAATPVSEGVPEVAVVRLQSLLNKNLPESQWRAVAEKLAEAQVAANQPEATLVLLSDARLRDLPCPALRCGLTHQ